MHVTTASSKVNYNKTTTNSAHTVIIVIVTNPACIRVLVTIQQTFSTNFINYCWNHFQKVFMNEHGGCNISYNDTVHVSHHCWIYLNITKSAEPI